MNYLTLVIALFMTPAVFAAGNSNGSGYSNNSDNPDIGKNMKAAHSLIADQSYKAAIRKLNNVIRGDYKNADAWNLLGYSNRKLGKYKKANKAYRKALKYNPAHKGALEYQGELFIETKQFDKARANRATLAALCPIGCEELSLLDEALAQVN
ncbi:MAG: tetratricopeptide repeat protein [Granulosicoccaceae bacterium]